MSIAQLKANLRKPKPNGLGAEEEYWTTINRLLAIISTQIFLDVDNPVIKTIWGKIQAELPAYQMEGSTKICSSISELVDALTELRREASKLAERHGATLDMRSTPWHGFKVKVFPKPRYLKLLAERGELLRDGFITGLHIHHGLESMEDGIAMSNVMRDLLPLFIAVSQCSPTMLGVDHGNGSERILAYLGMVDNPVPPMLDSVEHFEQIATEEDFYNDLSYCWWGFRINMAGSGELRICDMQPKVEYVGQIMALYRVCVAMIRAGHLTPTQRSREDILTDVIATAENPRAYEVHISFIKRCADFAATYHMAEDVTHINQLLTRLEGEN